MVETTSSSFDFSQPFKHLVFTPIVNFKNARTNNNNEQDGIAGNGKMIAVNWESTSSIAVFNAAKEQNFDAKIPLIRGHSGSIFDMQWSPFEDRLLATCADDGKVKFWVFDDYEGLTGTGSINEADMEIEAHPRRCQGIQWHAAAENLICTHSVDTSLKIWDINEDRSEEPVFTYANEGTSITQARWSPLGKMIGGMRKNKTLVIVDPR